MDGNDSPRYAVFTFFKMNGCGPCNSYYAVQAGSDAPNPSGPWATTATDKELVDKDGVEFALYKFGSVRNDKNEVVDFLEVPKVYEQRVTSAPYLELRVPNDLTNGIRYMGDRSNPQAVKEWVKQNLNTPAFKSYREAVQQGRLPPMTSNDIRRQFEIIRDAPDVQTSDKQVSAFNKSLEQRFQSRNGRSQQPQSQQQPQFQQPQQHRSQQPSYEEPQQRQYPRAQVNVAGMGANEAQPPIETGDVRYHQQVNQPSKKAHRFMPSNYGQ
jgi:hypothetical protein